MKNKINQILLSGIVVLALGAVSAVAQSAPFSSVTYGDSQFPVTTTISLAYLGARNCQLYPNLDNNSAICQNLDPLTNPFWGVGTTPLQQTNTGYHFGINGGPTQGYLKAVLKDPLNHFPDEPTALNSPIVITIDDDCINVEMDSDGTINAIEHGTVTSSNVPDYIRVGTSTLSFYRETPQGLILHAGASGQDQTGCSLTDAQHVTYVNAGLPGFDNLENDLKPISGGLLKIVQGQ